MGRERRYCNVCKTETIFRVEPEYYGGTVRDLYQCSKCDDEFYGEWRTEDYA